MTWPAFVTGVTTAKLGIYDMKKLIIAAMGSALIITSGAPVVHAGQVLYGTFSVLSEADFSGNVFRSRYHRSFLLSAVNMGIYFNCILQIWDSQLFQ